MPGYRHIPWLLVLLAVAGIGISGYLVATHYGDQPIACGGVGQCDYVNSSEYASVGGIPVSLLGLGMYGALLAAAFYWTKRPDDDRRMVAYWGLALAGAGYAAYLTYVELAILEAICVWCVASAVVLTVSLAIATAALLIVPPDDELGDGGSEPERPKSRRSRRQSSASSQSS